MEPRRRRLSPAAERRQGEILRARIGLLLIVVGLLVAGVLLHYRLRRQDAAPPAPAAGSRTSTSGDRRPG